MKYRKRYASMTFRERLECSESRDRTWYTVDQAIMQLACMQPDTVREMVRDGRIASELARAPYERYERRAVIHRDEIDRVMRSVEPPKAESRLAVIPGPCRNQDGACNAQESPVSRSNPRVGVRAHVGHLDGSEVKFGGRNA